MSPIVTNHEIVIAASEDDVFQTLVDVKRWSVIFPPTVHVVQRSMDSSNEQIKIWASANGDLKSWTSHRVLDHKSRLIEFHQVESAAPVKSMSGSWSVRPLSSGQCVVSLGHSYESISGLERDNSWIGSAVEKNSRAELLKLKASCEADSHASLLTTFTDAIPCDFVSGEKILDFIWNAALWPERLNHVSNATVQDFESDSQSLAMDTIAPDGSTHRTQSYRVRLDDKIVYKQTILPALLNVHLGEWRIVPDLATGNGYTVSSTHTVSINAENVEEVLGRQSSVDDAKMFVRRALGSNSLKTLEAASAFLA